MVARAEPDQVAQIGNIDRPAAFPDEHDIERSQKVGSGIDQGSVEIEDEGRGGVHHGKGEGMSGVESCGTLGGNIRSQIVILT